MWMLLACTTAPPTEERAADPVPAFTFAGCQELVRGVRADGEVWVSTLLYLDEQRTTAWNYEGGDESDWGASTWEGACRTWDEVHWVSPGWVDHYETKRTCDDAGEPIREDLHEELTQDDLTSTASWAYAYTNTYDADDQLVAYDMSYIGAPGHSTVWWTVTLTWEGGHVVEEQWVDPAGVRYTRTITSRWEDDRLAERATVDDSEPPWGTTERWTYDELGRVTEESWSLLEDPEDGGWMRYGYADDTPRQTTMERSEDGWATLSATATATWTCPG